MNVRMISYSKPSREMYDEGLLDVQELVAFCARVSNPSNQFNTETSEKLIKYLIKHQHWSPLEMVSACLEIETTRDIARQMLRHRSFSFQEFSQRYADPTKDLSFVLREARLQDTKNRQNSVENNNLALAAWWEERQKRVIEEARNAISDFSNKGFKLAKVKVSQKMTVTEKEFVLVQEFQSAKIAGEYINAYKAGFEYLDDFQNNKIFIINQENLKKLIETSKFDEYKVFYDDNY